MVCGGPGRRGRKGREPNWSHEWEGSQGCGGDRAKKHGGTLEQFEAIPLNYGGRSLVRGGCWKDARHLATHHSWTAQTLTGLYICT